MGLPLTNLILCIYIKLHSCSIYTTITSTIGTWTLQNFGFDEKLVDNYACSMTWVNQLLFFPHKTFLKIFRKLITLGHLLTFFSIYELHSFLLFFICSLLC